jgi:hypothetical protein
MSCAMLAGGEMVDRASRRGVNEEIRFRAS